MATTRLLIGDEEPHVGPVRTRAAADAQKLVSLRYWHGKREIALEWLAHDRALRKRLDERADSLDARLKDGAMQGHPEYWRGCGRWETLNAWAIHLGATWLTLLERTVADCERHAVDLAKRLSTDDARRQCVAVGWPADVCGATDDEADG